MAIPKPSYLPSEGRNIPPDIPNIFTAAENNDIDALYIAMQYYSVNELDPVGMTPLHYAASTLANRTIDALLAHPQIDATLADAYGRSAATVAYECWNLLSDQIVEKLNPHCYPWVNS